MLHNSANSSCFRHSFFNHQLYQKVAYNIRMVWLRPIA